MKQKIIIYGFLILLILCNSCKKHSTIDSHQNNIVNATIAFSSGNKVIINATGSNAAIGHSLYFDVTNVKGTNDVNEAVFLSFDNVSATGNLSLFMSVLC